MGRSTVQEQVNTIKNSMYTSMGICRSLEKERPGHLSMQSFEGLVREQSNRCKYELERGPNILEKHYEQLQAHHVCSSFMLREAQRMKLIQAKAKGQICQRGS